MTLKDNASIADNANALLLYCLKHTFFKTQSSLSNTVLYTYSSQFPNATYVVTVSLCLKHGFLHRLFGISLVAKAIIEELAENTSVSVT